MGGEWEFFFKIEQLSTFNLSLYQKLLLEIREKFKNISWDEATVRWCKEQPPADNIFVELKCSPNFLDQNPTWKLLWDPNLERVDKASISLQTGMHGKINSYLFRKKSQAIQQKLVKVFPKHFELWFENYEDHDFDYENDQLEYHKGCDMRCANCGFCW